MNFDDFTSCLSEELDPVRSLALRLHDAGTKFRDDAWLLSHRPGIAPEAYAVRLYTPLSVGATARYQTLHDFTPLPGYLRILKRLKGANIFELSLFGLPKTMANDPPLLDRRVDQPMDLACANKSWKSEYRVPDDWFYFGFGPLTHDENAGYFIETGGAVVSAKRNGDFLNTWASFHAFLADELPRLERIYPDHEAYMSKLLHQGRSPWWKRLFDR